MRRHCGVPGCAALARPLLPLLLLLLVMLASLGCGVVGSEDAASVTASPPVAAVRAGSETSFECTSSSEGNATVTLAWLYANGTAVSGNASERVHSSNSSSLEVRGARLQDGGVYTCRDSLGNGANVTLKVYEPDSYFFEGMVVVGINCGLILIFILGLAYTCYRDRRPARQHGKRHLGTHRPILKSGPKMDVV